MSTAGSTSKAVLKIMMVGSTGVGKTRIVYRFANGTFSSDATSTLGIDCKIKTIKLENGSNVKLQIWDPAGQERFNSITTAYYRGAMGIALVYDVASRKSFDELSSWIAQVQKNASERAVLMLLGNKNDLTSEREVTTENGQELADLHSMIFMEVSAKTGENIEEAFTTIADKVFEKKLHEKKESEDIDTIGITASEEAGETSRRGRCSC